MKTSVLTTAMMLLITFELFSQLQIIGVNRTAHQVEMEMRYRQPHTSDLSARYQIFIKNEGNLLIKGKSLSTLTINNKTPEQWHASGNLAWHLFPHSVADFPESIPAGALMVWQFNGHNEHWLNEGGPGNKTWSLQTHQLDTIIKDEPQQVWLEYIAFTGQPNRIDPDQVTIHLTNESERDFQIQQVRFWTPVAGGSHHFLFPQNYLKDFQTWPKDRRLAKGGHAILRISNHPFPITFTAVEVVVQDSGGAVRHLWAYQKIKKETFDISAGWANMEAGGKPAFLNEKFLQTMEALYINTAHYNGQPGFSDRPEIFNRYPIKYFGHLLPWKKFDYDSILPRVHGIEILGEPQYGGGTPVDPQVVCTQLAPFAASRLPTTLTHSEERIWRFYAGLSDYPHYDAYRVSAPSADDWKNYDRWNGKRIAWGSPLETIGTMTRSLRRLNRPFPIAYWSQGPHEGWEVYGGRMRTSPTPSELRAQAYHALASGITSLYWFNLSYKSLMLFPELMEPMQRIGREIRLLDQLYLTGTQWYYQRIGDNRRPKWDLSTLVSAEGVLLFALDLDYRADEKTKTFIFKPDKSVSLTFRIPEWINGSWQMLKLDKDAITSMKIALNGKESLIVNDRITEAGIYILVPDEASARRLQASYQQLMNQECILTFNPAVREKDLEELKSVGSRRE